MSVDDTVDRSGAEGAVSACPHRFWKMEQSVVALMR